MGHIRPLRFRGMMTLHSASSPSLCLPSRGLLCCASAFIVNGRTAMKASFFCTPVRQSCLFLKCNFGWPHLTSNDAAFRM